MPISSMVSASLSWARIVRILSAMSARMPLESSFSKRSFNPSCRNPTIVKDCSAYRFTRQPERSPSSSCDERVKFTLFCSSLLGIHTIRQPALFSAGEIEKIIRFIIPIRGI